MRYRENLRLNCVEECGTFGREFFEFDNFHN